MYQCINVSMYLCIYVSMLSTYLSIGLSGFVNKKLLHKMRATNALLQQFWWCGAPNYTHLNTLQWVKVMGIVTGHGSYFGLRPFPGPRTTTAYTLARPQESGIQDHCRSWTENLDLDNSFWFRKLWNLPWTSAMWACHVLSRLFFLDSPSPWAPSRVAPMVYPRQRPRWPFCDTTRLDQLNQLDPVSQNPWGTSPRSWRRRFSQQCCLIKGEDGLSMP